MIYFNICKKVIQIFISHLMFVQFLEIEEMTHKTGNYKHFDVFVNMLEAALNRVQFEYIY